jgi:hypothetical protein
LSVTSRSCAAELLLVVGELGIGLGGHPLGLGAGAVDARLAPLAQLEIRLEQELVRDEEQDQEQHELNDDREIDVDQWVPSSERYDGRLIHGQVPAQPMKNPWVGAACL